ncbi:P1 family peptidase [Castellaniella sp.]|uniref:DmpA family aminopeptidase n=1 Tax=Castellaniella sp. TaxID=1955812 RepID=UPI003A92C5E7
MNTEHRTGRVPGADHQMGAQQSPARGKRLRARELGLPLPGKPGIYNAITDVPGVLVGFNTLSSQADPTLQTGALPVQTGVTAILPVGFASQPRPVWAGHYALNGNGEMTGTHWIADGGYFVGPILLTNTHAVGAAHQAATQWIIDQYHEQWHKHHLWAMPVVAETYDGVLNDINGMHVRPEHARQAIDSARGGQLPEGNVGGGAGMIAYEFKAGTGTASRQVTLAGQTFHVGTLVQANHGLRPWLTVCGVPVGQKFTEDRIPGMSREQGSVVCILATDIPLLPMQLQKLARRAALGIGRGGTPGGNSSGDIFLAFSVANPMPIQQLAGPWGQLQFLNDCLLDEIYLAAIEVVEEAILNALLMARDIPTARPAGAICRAIDGHRLAEWVKAGRHPDSGPQEA